MRKGDLLGRDQLSASLGIDRKVLTIALAEFAARKTE